MKRVFILCDLYPPAFAPRVAYLTQYLRQFGWSPIVFTEDVATHQLFSDFSIPCSVHRVNLTHTNTLVRAASIFLELTVEYKERCFYRALLRYVEEQQISPPDAILCMTYRKFPLSSARRLAALWDIPWIADCRDLIEQYSNSDFLPKPLYLGSFRLTWIERILAKWFITLRNRSLRHADEVVTVAQWHRVLLQKLHKSVTVIYNGCDQKLFAPYYPEVDTFRIVFTGRLLSLSMRNPSLLLQALASPALKDVPLSVDFYTDDFSAEQLRSLSLFTSDPRCDIRDMVPSRSVPKLLAEASVILLLGNKEGQDDSPNGMVSTKLFEALAMQKPTLLLPDKDGEAAQILTQSGCGIATDSVDEVVDFITIHYKHWQQFGFTAAHHADRQYLQGFSRRRGAQQFASLLDKITQ